MVDRKGLLQWIDPLVLYKGESLKQRPLMLYMDQVEGPNRLLGMMFAEQIELHDEVHILRQLPRSEWNGNLAKAAEEAADVLVIGAALLFVHGISKLTMSQQDRLFFHLGKIKRVQAEIGISIPEVAAAVIHNKNDRFNYREFAFQNLTRESDYEKQLRFMLTVKGLKHMRKGVRGGILTDSILNSWGFEEEVHGQNPVLAYQLLKGIANGSLIMSSS